MAFKLLYFSYKLLKTSLLLSSHTWEKSFIYLLITFSEFFNVLQGVIIVRNHRARTRMSKYVLAIWTVAISRIVFRLKFLQVCPHDWVFLDTFSLLFEGCREVSIVRFARCPRNVGAEDGVVKVCRRKWRQQCFS